MSEVMGRAYFNARGAKALQLAQKAKDSQIAEIHHRMAKSYFELAELAPEESSLPNLSAEQLGKSK